MEFKHVPVMLEECMQALNLKDGGIYFDCTLGGAGHSYEILKRTSPSGKLIATDLDEDAIKAATERLSVFEGRFTVVKDNYKNFRNILNDLNIEAVDGILIDMGISSNQIATRGMAYMEKDARLDMRMDKSQDLDAWKVVNTYDEKRLADVIYKYGEEKFSFKIADNICKARQIKSIDTTGELVEIIDKSIPFKFKRETHPAKKTFQAIRIEVNDELGGMEQCIKDMVSGLKKGGRIAIMTFHSLEDRIVKLTLKDLETACVCDKSFPICVCGRKQQVKLINKKPIEATDEELSRNSRAKSAKLRIAEKI